MRKMCSTRNVYWVLAVCGILVLNVAAKDAVKISTGVVAQAKNGEYTVIPDKPEDNNPEHIAQVMESLKALPPEEMLETQYPFNDKPTLVASRYVPSGGSYLAYALSETMNPEMMSNNTWLISDLVCVRDAAAGEWILSMTVNDCGVLYQIKEFHYNGESSKNVWRSGTKSIDIVQ